MTTTNQTESAFKQLLSAVYSALETYSNVHRGSGHFSMATTRLFEHSRKVVLEYLALNKRKYVVIFCTAHRAHLLISQLEPESFKMVSSREIGLPVGVWAVAARKNALPRELRFQSGGGTARLVSRNRITWAGIPGRFEAGTPAIVSIIAFARALQLIRQHGITGFQDIGVENSTAAGILYHDELEQFSGRELLDELVKTLIGRDVRVPTAGGARPFINLDNGASTPTFTPVWKAACQALWQSEQIQQAIVNEVKAICARALNAPPGDYDIVFTSNTTEGINLVAEKLSHEPSDGLEPVVLNTILEHNSNDLPWRMIPDCSMVRLSIDANGFVDLDELESVLRSHNQDLSNGKKRIRIVSVSGASNVLGVYNDLDAISRIVHKYDARLMVDAAQMVAHRNIDVQGCGIDYLAFSAHKVYAPFGCGVLVVRKGMPGFSSAELQPVRSSGEENAWGIAALGKAIVLLQRIGMDVIRKEEQALTARALQGLSRIPGLQLFGITDTGSKEFARKGGVVVFALKGVMPNKVAKELALRDGIGIRFGCHCSHILIKHLIKISPFLERVQFLIVALIPQINLAGLDRISIGIGNTEQEIDTLISSMGTIARKSGSPGRIIRQQRIQFIKARLRVVFGE
jgi:selenocysteine lyase/cysteine desulfurase